MAKTGDLQGKDYAGDLATTQVAAESLRKANKAYMKGVNAGDVTGTLTTSQLDDGVLYSNPGGAITLTLPTAAQLVAASEPDAVVGQGLQFTVVNKSGANIITVAVGAGVTATGTLTVAVSTSATFYLSHTNVGTGTEAVDLFRL